jgi:NTE family protein
MGVMSRDSQFSLSPNDLTTRTETSAGVALCLSGRGYQAMLFQAGCLCRLNELGWLPRIDCVSSVSGASITAAVLALKWKTLAFDEHGIGRQFVDQVIEPVRRLASDTIEDWSVIGAAFSSYSPGEIIANALDEYLFSGATLQNLPDGSGDGEPRFLFTASNVAAGSLVSFSRPDVCDSRAGRVQQPDLRLALAVAASTSPPPWLSTVLTLNNYGIGDRIGLGAGAPPSQSLTLMDGGVLDSLGLETVWDSYHTFLVSDGGCGSPRDPDPTIDAMSHAARITDLLFDRLRFARRRELLDVLLAQSEHDGRTGTYWDITADITDGVERNLPYPQSRTRFDVTDAAALRAIDESRQEELINRGYALCDTAIRRWNPSDADALLRIPCPLTPDKQLHCVGRV